jgi:hypothetical protein
LAKRAKTLASDEPPASTVGVPETIIISPEPSPRRSPQLSPQRESITYFPLASVGVSIFSVDIAGLVEEERQQEEPLMAAPNVPPPSTTPPRDEPSARGSPVEPIHVEEDPAGSGVGGPTSATTVAGKGETIPQQVDTGKPLASKDSFPCAAISSFFVFFCLLELRPWFHLVSSLLLQIFP